MTGIADAPLNDRYISGHPEIQIEADYVVQ